MVIVTTFIAPPGLKTFFRPASEGAEDPPIHGEGRTSAHD
jgi:hypothetical protein